MKIITLLRKPLEGTVAENTLKHGCGGINIDATRVGTEVMTSTSMGSLGVMHDDGWKSKPIDPVESTGRWPANFILTHLEGCKLRGTTKIKQGKSSNTLGGADRKVGLYKDGLKKEAENRYRGEEEVAEWDCAEGCPIKILDEQSGISKSTNEVSRFFKSFVKPSR